MELTPVRMRPPEPDPKAYIPWEAQVRLPEGEKEEAYY